MTLTMTNMCCVDVKKKFHEMTEDKVMLAFCIFELIEQKTFCRRIFFLRAMNAFSNP